MPFERARTQLLLGQLIPSPNGKRRVPRTLREALRAFDAMGTPLWADRARPNSARADVVPTTTSRSRIGAAGCRAGGVGMTNRDVAAACSSARRPSEAQPGARIYRKLRHQDARRTREDHRRRLSGVSSIRLYDDLN